MTASLHAGVDVCVRVRFLREPDAKLYAYLWNVADGHVDVGTLAVVVSPHGGLKVVEVMEVSEEIDARATKRLVGLVSLAPGWTREKAAEHLAKRVPDEVTWNDGPF